MYHVTFHPSYLCYPQFKVCKTNKGMTREEMKGMFVLFNDASRAH